MYEYGGMEAWRTARHKALQVTLFFYSSIVAPFGFTCFFIS